MAAYFEITAYNTQSLYFWGTKDDAGRYVEWLNRNRDINVYHAAAIPEDQWAAYEGRDDILSGDEPYWDDFMGAEA